ncbi:MAG TPA: acyltransferase, partial [Kofleriaceae bacterium]
LTFSRMDSLGAGALLALVEAKRPDALHRILRPALAVGACAIVVFGALYLGDAHFRYYQQRALYDVLGYALATVMCTCAIVAVYCAPPTFLFGRALRYIGMISYAAYLWHPLVLDQVHRLHLRGPVTALLGYAFTLAMATASWYLLDQPLQRLRNRVRPLRTDVAKRKASSHVLDDRALPSATAVASVTS